MRLHVIPQHIREHMKILIDFTQIPVQRAGAGVYAENLVHELPPCLRREDLLFLLLQSDEVKLPLLLAEMKNVRLLFIPSVLFRNRLVLMVFEQLILPWLLLRHDIDVVHSLHYTFPFWAPSARVVTFHDLTMLLWPQMHTWGRRLIMPVYIRLAWRAADEIIFVSAATRSDAEKLLPPVEGRLRTVVPLGISAETFSLVSEDDSGDRLTSLQVKKPYLLFIGTIEPRKNLVRVIQAFEGLASQFPKHTLVLVGKLGWDFEPVLKAVASSAYRERIRYIGYIADEDKRALLAGSSVLVYPSLYEGFGLPVLEAMAAGVPVVTSNVSSLPEVVGTAALMVDPESIEQLIAAMVRILSDPELAKTLGALGRERARVFSWKNTAAETYKAYLAAYKSPR
jgi:glycosyltransferase involved in cell wall biosynthesis